MGAACVTDSPPSWRESGETVAERGGARKENGGGTVGWMKEEERPRTELPIRGGSKYLAPVCKPFNGKSSF